LKEQKELDSIEVTVRGSLYNDIYKRRFTGYEDDCGSGPDRGTWKAAEEFQFGYRRHVPVRTRYGDEAGRCGGCKVPRELCEGEHTGIAGSARDAARQYGNGIP